MRIYPKRLSLITGAVCVDDQLKDHTLTIQWTEIYIQRIISPIVRFMPLTQARSGTAKLIVQFKHHIAAIGLILTANQGAEMITTLDLGRRIYAAYKSIRRILRDRKQSRFILGLSAPHDRITQVKHVTS